MIESTLLPPPVDIGAPEHFTHWREYQDEAVTNAIQSPSRFVVQSMPTGSGKSLAYIAQALISGARACVLTSTKGLQDQLLRDFESAGLVDIRGKGNYQCLEVPTVTKTGKPLDPTTVDMGPCQFGSRCDRRWNTRETSDGSRVEVPPNPEKTVCPYYGALRAAQESQLIVTNYAFWMAVHAYSPDSLGTFDLLILDEAHNAPAELASFLGAELTAWDVERVLEDRFPQWTDFDSWRSWAMSQLDPLEDILERTRGSMATQEGGRTGAIRYMKAAKALQSNCQKLATAQGDWVVDLSYKGRSAEFNVVNPSPYAEGALFLGVPKVLMVSATVRPKTCDLLGIPDDDLDFQEYPHTFPKAMRPVIYIPTVRMKYDMTRAQVRTWLGRIDNIIRERQDRKGVIHTVSYKRRDIVMAESRFSNLMVSHGGASERDEVIQAFKQSKEPRILVSPSVTTGFDFPYSDCEYQIIGKVPWPSTQSAIIRARRKEDPDWEHYLAYQDLIQAAGRGTRAPDDHCEVFIIDDQFWWFVWKYKEFAPEWFLETVSKVKRIPTPSAALLVGA